MSIISLTLIFLSIFPLLPSPLVLSPSTSLSSPTPCLPCLSVHCISICTISMPLFTDVCPLSYASSHHLFCPFPRLYSSPSHSILSLPKSFLFRDPHLLTAFSTASNMAWYPPASIATVIAMHPVARTTRVTWQHDQGRTCLAFLPWCPASQLSDDTPIVPGQGGD